MPYYRITITDISGKVMQGVRDDPMESIDAYYGKVHSKAIRTLKNRLASVEVVMLVSTSQEVKDYKQKELYRQPSVAWRPPLPNNNIRHKYDAYANNRKAAPDKPEGE